MVAPLPRRAFLGLRLTGERVAGVVSGSMADEAGLRAGDRLLAIDGEPIGGADDLARLARRCGARESAELRFERDGRALARRARVKRWPLEELGFPVDYREVLAAGDVRLRLIVTEPAARDPAGLIVYLQGIALESIELGGNELVDALIRGWSRRHLATARLERRGIGDSEGGPAGAVDFGTEVADIGAALRDLGDRYGRVILFGHSLGGMIAPLVAGSAAAVIVFGTSARRWFECVDASARRQLCDRGLAGAAIDEHLARVRELRAAGGTDDDRCAAFHAQLDATDLAAAWTGVTAPVLALWGTRDRVVCRAEGEMIAGLARDAEFRELEGLDHGGAPDPAALAEVTAAWILARLRP